MDNKTKRVVVVQRHFLYVDEVEVPVDADLDEVIRLCFIQTAKPINKDDVEDNDDTLGYILEDDEFMEPGVGDNQIYSW